MSAVLTPADKALAAGFAGELEPDKLAQLEREIATEAARTDLECIAARVQAVPGALGPCYDITHPGNELVANDAEIRASEMRHLAKAVQYLDLRGLLVRPVSSHPHIVCLSAVLLHGLGGAV